MLRQVREFAKKAKVDEFSAAINDVMTNSDESSIMRSLLFLSEGINERNINVGQAIYSCVVLTPFLSKLSNLLINRDSEERLTEPASHIISAIINHGITHKKVSRVLISNSSLLSMLTYPIVNGIASHITVAHCLWALDGFARIGVRAARKILNTRHFCESIGGWIRLTRTSAAACSLLCTLCRYDSVFYQLACDPMYVCIVEILAEICLHPGSVPGTPSASMPFIHAGVVTLPSIGLFDESISPKIEDEKVITPIHPSSSATRRTASPLPHRTPPSPPSARPTRPRSSKMEFGHGIGVGPGVEVDVDDVQMGWWKDVDFTQYGRSIETRFRDSLKKYKSEEESEEEKEKEEEDQEREEEEREDSEQKLGQYQKEGSFGRREHIKSMDISRVSREVDAIDSGSLGLSEDDICMSPFGKILDEEYLPADGGVFSQDFIEQYHHDAATSAATTMGTILQRSEQRALNIATMNGLFPECLRYIKKSINRRDLYYLFLARNYALGCKLLKLSGWQTIVADFIDCLSDIVDRFVRLPVEEGGARKSGMVSETLLSITAPSAPSASTSSISPTTGLTTHVSPVAIVRDKTSSLSQRVKTVVDTHPPSLSSSGVSTTSGGRPGRSTSSMIETKASVIQLLVVAACDCGMRIHTTDMIVDLQFEEFTKVLRIAFASVCDIPLVHAYILKTMASLKVIESNRVMLTNGLKHLYPYAIVDENGTPVSDEHMTSSVDLHAITGRTAPLKSDLYANISIIDALASYGEMLIEQNQENLFVIFCHNAKLGSIYSAIKGEVGFSLENRLKVLTELVREYYVPGKGVTQKVEKPLGGILGAGIGI
ncbi:hypothetical protein ADUPG1_009893 [Aduncisulcus paluster]|uniref:Uncharacterized protein n=1 Tax=Aduncisulcus paluster TaxID=2918883 RepID=A0ABQ5KX71_9EUKA|nr:hypothetical protein ADUPG1_009893 [Aduncisulcus paluster]